MTSTAELAAPPLVPAKAATLTPRDFLPAAISTVAVIAAILVQHAVIEAAQRWRER